MNKTGGIILPDFKLYYRATIIKTAWYWQKHTHTHTHTPQQTRIESPEINPHAYGQIIFDKGTKNTQWRKENLFNRWCWGKWKATRKRMKLDHSLSLCRKINSKWIKMDRRSETINSREENIDTRLMDLALREDFMIWPQRQGKYRQKYMNGTISS